MSHHGTRSITPFDDTQMSTPEGSRSVSRASTTSSKTPANSRKRSKANMTNVDPKKEALLELAHATLTSPEEDEYTVVGKRLAFQLKGMEDKQRLIAEKLIADVMYYGRMGRLSEDATISLLPNVSSGNHFVNYRATNPILQTRHSSDYQPSNTTTHSLQNDYQVSGIPPLEPNNTARYVHKEDNLQIDLSEYVHLH